MSHFSVLVITDRKPSKDELSRIMQPYHEYECTGIKDQYVVWVDCHKEVLETFDKETACRWRDASGKLHDPYQNRFYREPTTDESAKIGTLAGTGGGHGISWHSQDWKDGRGYRTKVHMQAQDVGMEEVSVPQRDVESIEDWAQSYGGWTRNEDRFNRFGRITNPNARWDWWTVGGRWTGMLSPVYDPEEDPTNTEVCNLCGGTGLRNDTLGRKARAEDPAYTCNGCDGKKIRTKWPTQWKHFNGDQIRRGDLQLEALKTQAEQRAATRYDLFSKIVAGRALPDWDALEAEQGIEKARVIYWDDPVMKDLRANKEFVWWERDEFTVDRDTYLSRARERAVAPFAIVKDGKWYEKGKMGWWACTHGEKESEVWLAEVAKLVIDLPADSWLTVVDCHI